MGKDSHLQSRTLRRPSALFFCIFGLGCYSELWDSEISRVKKQPTPCLVEEGRESQRALGEGAGKWHLPACLPSSLQDYPRS